MMHEKSRTTSPPSGSTKIVRVCRAKLFRDKAITPPRPLVWLGGCYFLMAIQESQGGLQFVQLDLCSNLHISTMWPEVVEETCLLPQPILSTDIWDKEGDYAQSFWSTHLFLFSLSSYDSFESIGGLSTSVTPSIWKYLLHVLLLNL